MDKRLEIITKRGGVKSRQDAETVVRIVRQEFLSGAVAYAVQLAATYHCKECGNISLEWKDVKRFPLKDNKKETDRECKEKAIQSRISYIDQLVENTISREVEVNG